MLTITGQQQVEVVDLPKYSTTVTLFDTTRSILSTILDLWKSKYYFVAVMIFSFSILIPVSKNILLIYIWFCKNQITRAKIFTFIRTTGKWSMCDVFIVAIFLAYLSTGSNHGEESKEISIMGYTAAKVMPHVVAELKIGFWCFLTYCLMSLASLQLYDDK